MSNTPLGPEASIFDLPEAHSPNTETRLLTPISRMMGAAIDAAVLTEAELEDLSVLPKKEFHIGDKSFWGWEVATISEPEDQEKRQRTDYLQFLTRHVDGFRQFVIRDMTVYEPPEPPVTTVDLAYFGRTLTLAYPEDTLRPVQAWLERTVIHDDFLSTPASDLNPSELAVLAQLEDDFRLSCNTLFVARAFGALARGFVRHAADYMDELDQE